jgi:hypothetical protein
MVEDKRFKPVRSSENKTEDMLLLERFKGVLKYSQSLFPADEALAEENILNLSCVGRWGEFVEDIGAQDAKAMKLYNTHHQWCVQQLVDDTLTYDKGETYELRLRVRLEKDEKASGEDQALTAGIWNTEKRRSVASGVIKISDANEDGYKWYTLFRWRPGESQKFWIAPGKPGKSGSRGFKSVFIDQISVRRVK